MRLVVGGGASFEGVGFVRSCLRVSPLIQGRSVRVVWVVIGTICGLPGAPEFGDKLKAVMASSSGSTQQLGEVKVSDVGCGMDESSEVLVSDYVTAPATESVLGSPSGESFLSAQCDSIVGGLEVLSLGKSRVEEEIERSKQHWSSLAEFSEVGEEVVAEVDNVEVFKALQMHPTWGRFFATFGHRYRSRGELTVGEKLAEGAQGEVYDAKVVWREAIWNEFVLKHGREFVVKVFKEGTYLRQVHQQLSHGYLQFKAEAWKKEDSNTRTWFPRYYCNIHFGILLENGRFAFLMDKEHIDLRTLLDRHLELKASENCGPFSHDDAQCFMYKIAVGLKWLHDHDIVHRDLKAANVLVTKVECDWPKWACFIADYECSAGVAGTGFFRAPEILQAVKDKKLSSRQEVFSKAVDVYSYGMTCYEILTGKLPFEEHVPSDYDVVLCGQQLVVPEYVDDWTHFLLSRCWQLNPLVRPTMDEIVNSFLDHSSRIREWQEGVTEHIRTLN